MRYNTCVDDGRNFSLKFRRKTLESFTAYTKTDVFKRNFKKTLKFHVRFTFFYTNYNYFTRACRYGINNFCIRHGYSNLSSECARSN